MFKVTEQVMLTARGSITAEVVPAAPCALNGCLGELLIIGAWGEGLGRLHLDETNRRELIEALGGVVSEAPHSGHYGAGDYHCDACGGSFPDQDARRAHRPGGACSGRPRNADYGACAYKEGRCSGRCVETWCEIRDGAPSDPLPSS